MTTLFDIELSVPLQNFELNYRLATDERCVGVFGPSGAGKTTVIEHVAGWRKGARGHVRVGEHTLFDSEAGVFLPPRVRGIGYVPQDILLFPHWNVIRNVTAGRGRGKRRWSGSSALVARVLDTLELTPLQERPVRHLSGGERHRVALARALCSEPALLLLDEPLASLDLRLRRRILADLVRVRHEFDLPMLLLVWLAGVRLANLLNDLTKFCSRTPHEEDEFKEDANAGMATGDDEAAPGNGDADAESGHAPAGEGDPSGEA